MQVDDRGSREPLTGQPTKKIYLTIRKGIILCGIILFVVLTSVLIYYMQKPDGNEPLLERKDSTSSLDVRLPDTLKPHHYDLRIRPDIYKGDPKDFTFSGDVTVFFYVVNGTDTISLHQSDLTIDALSVLVKDSHGEKVCIHLLCIYN